MSDKFILISVEDETETIKVHRVNVDKEDFFNTIMGIADGLLTEKQDAEKE